MTSIYEKSYNTTKEYRKNNPEKIKHIRRKAKLKQFYGLSLEQYDTMFENQQGCCAICGIHQDVLNRRLDVDHCHTTGKVRGLLCRLCNTSLGKYEKYREVFEVYLNKAVISEKE